MTDYSETLLTEEQAAQYLNMSCKAFRRYARRRNCPTIKTDDGVRYGKHDLQRCFHTWLDALKLARLA